MVSASYILWMQNQQCSLLAGEIKGKIGRGKKEVSVVKDALIFMGGLGWKSSADTGEGCCHSNTKPRCCGAGKGKEYD